MSIDGIRAAPEALSSASKFRFDLEIMNRPQPSAPIAAIRQQTNVLRLFARPLPAAGTARGRLSGQSSGLSLSVPFETLGRSRKLSGPCCEVNPAGQQVALDLQDPLRSKLRRTNVL